MPRPWLLRTVVVCLALIAWPAGGGQAGEEHTLLERKHAFRLQARRVDEKLFSQDTRSFAVEVFLEPKTRSWLFVGEGGQALAAAPAVKQKTPGKGQVIVDRLILPVRKADEESFRKDTRKINIEVYRDDGRGNLIYVSETGALAVILNSQERAGKAGPPRALYRLALKVRPAKEAPPLGPYRACSVEVYHDPATNCVLYVADNGAVAVLPAMRRLLGTKTLAAEWSHGLDLVARPPSQAKFEQRTPRFGAEVYLDDNQPAWVYVTETLHLAVGRAHDPIDSAKVKAPRWQAGFGPAGKSGKRWSAELYHNSDAGHLVFVAHTGALALIEAK